MYKIEEQYVDDDGKWKKTRHRMYEKETAFETYWKMHCGNVFPWYIGTKRLVAFQDGKQIRVHNF